MSAKIVRFDLWCNSCRFCDIDEAENPCHECLSEPVREDSRQPIKYLESDNKKKSNDI